MATIVLDTKNKMDMINLTREVEHNIPKNFHSGVCHLFCMHTTAALTVNENADPSVQADIIYKSGQLIPLQDDGYKHAEGNSAAHIKSSMFGPSLTVPIEGGILKLGKWQGIYFCEFDGPRKRRVVDVKFVKDFYS